MSPIFEVSKFYTRICVMFDTLYPSLNNIGDGDGELEEDTRQKERGRKSYEENGGER